MKSTKHSYQGGGATVKIPKASTRKLYLRAAGKAFRVMLDPTGRVASNSYVMRRQMRSRALANADSVWEEVGREFDSAISPFEDLRH